MFWLVLFSGKCLSFLYMDDMQWARVRGPSPGARVWDWYALGHCERAYTSFSGWCRRWRWRLDASNGVNSMSSSPSGQMVYLRVWPEPASEWDDVNTVAHRIYYFHNIYLICIHTTTPRQRNINTKHESEQEKTKEGESERDRKRKKRERERRCNS